MDLIEAMLTVTTAVSNWANGLRPRLQGTMYVRA